MVETLIIIAIIAIIGLTFGVVFSALRSGDGREYRDWAARQHDSALARFYDAQATKLRLENDQAQAELRLAANQRRQETCEAVRER